ncbi:MAG: ATP-binding cassette domain-containing protein [Pseudomonadales bacterium]|nr:ATP-binding cassette domain-containing protein [Pseudomonadales bacterium]
MTDWAIETTNLGQRFGSMWAVKGLNLQVPQGSVFGLLGENGAGKSTTIQMLMGLLPPTEGHSKVLGMDPMLDELGVKSRVGYVPEHYGFYEYMRVREITAFVAAYHANWNYELQKQLISEFALNEDNKVKELSKGMRAKLALLMALSFEPEMLLLDEPAGGLDPAARRNFIETILSRYQQTGKTILVSSHLLNEFSGLIDHVAFMKDGGVDLAAPLEQLQKQMKRVRIVFESGIPESFDIHGAIETKLNGREAIATFENFNEEDSLAQINAFDPSHVVVEDLTLEDIFVVRVSA